MKARLPWILGIIFALAVLLTRTWGIQVDEIAYFHLAIHERLGDAPRTGKPYFFYFFNHSLYHLFRQPSGWLHPLILPVFYVVVTSSPCGSWPKRPYKSERAADGPSHYSSSPPLFHSTPHSSCCDRSLYWIRSCLKQDIRFYSVRTGEIESRICLP